MLAKKKALQAYGVASIDDQVASASPHRLVVMLFEGAIKSINMAKFFLEQGNVPEKGLAITKAIAIIEEGLRLSLDKSAGGELAENLDALYEYAAHQLLVANLRNDAQILDQVLTLLNDLKSSWASIDPSLQMGASPQPAVADATKTVMSLGRA
ncbi:flagellar export chaperone FliS [Deefgea tanakiae]|uniref:Flagellar secretion chaperone FliS n=1 Tax=Deefgea tanakiae TaxID=2865840 RepID=A0ABX8ZD25_9NEIS|nr:flagellar export chaperone FliS [Deefgea tanakiae]QZA79199.1 flagellar export chaperone FliS [Deefgea tanakiae]